MSRKVLFSAVKNEGPTLLEWVAYHRLIGFDTIYIASNDCSDGTDALLDALEQAELITKHIPHKPDPRFGPQKSAINALKKAKLLQDGDWFAFLDADEYLNVHLGAGGVDDLIEKIGTRQGMVIPWRLFGDGDTRGIIKRQISEDFRFAEPHPPQHSCQVKSIFRYRPGVLELGYGNMHRPQIVDAQSVCLDDFALAGDVSWDEDREINRTWISGGKSAGTAHISAPEFSAEFAQINHYSVRNRDMFELKKKRGRGFFRKKKAEEKARVRHNEKFYKTHNLNDVVDRSILRHATGLDEIIGRYISIPAVNEKYEACLTSTQDALNVENTTDNLVKALNSPATIQLNTGDAEIFLPQITLPETETECLTEHYRNAHTILEYGSGGSTVFAASLPHRPKVFSVESDQAWAEKLSMSILHTYPQADLHLKHVDIGMTKAWGRPKGHGSYLRYPDYSFGIYDDPDFMEPDLILIDGRFRQGCFYAGLFKMTKPVTILWDDYTSRGIYHGVEKYFQPTEVFGRMAKFEVSPITFPICDIVPITKAIMNSE